MMKLSQDDMMRFVDGTLDESRAREVDEYIEYSKDDEDARLLFEMREAVAVLREWDESEPVRASEKFWPSLRDQLPAAPPRRSWLKRTFAGVSVGNGARRPALQLSGIAAAIAVAVALGISFFAPKNAQQSLQANEISPTAQQFIHQSLARHNTYVAVQPPAMSGVTADGRTQDGDDTGDDDGDGSYTP